MITRSSFSLFLTSVSAVLASVMASAQGDFEWSRQIGDYPGKPQFLRIHDFDHDGLADVLVGDPSDSTVGLDAGSLRVVSGADGSTLFRVDGDPGDQLGNSLRLIGDMNGDAIDDFVVAAQGANADEGAVFLFSGIDGSLERRVDSPGGLRDFASHLSSVGDLDGDGYEEIGISYRPKSAAVICYSLVHDRPIGTVTSADYCVALGDVDNDGQGEVIAYSDFSFGTSARVVTAATGHVHWTHPWDPSAVGSIPDQNGNGTPDACFFGGFNYRFEILDGATGQAILIGPQGIDGNGGELTQFPDLDGDGADDLIGETWDRHAIICSSATGEVISTVTGYTGLIGRYPDDNGDGVTDLLLQSGTGGLEVVSLLPGLQLDPGTISASARDTCYASIDFSSARAGTRYVLLASECTFGAKSWINDFPLPLGWSPFLALTLSGTKIPGSTGFWGTLDAHGNALATLTPGPRAHRLIGRELWMAVLLYEEWGSVPIGLRTSLPQQIQFVP